MDQSAGSRPLKNCVELRGKDEWDVHRELIRRLFIEESRTVNDIVRILAVEENFHINKGMLQYRLRKWGLGKNFTRRNVFTHIHGNDMKSELRIRPGIDENRLRERAVKLLRSPASPDIHEQPRSIFCSVQSYVYGVHRSNNTNAASAQIINGFLNWAYGVPPSVYRLWSTMMGARLCHLLGKSDWSETLIRLGYLELEDCLHSATSSSEVILFMVHLLGLFQKQRPELKKHLLEHCYKLVMSQPKHMPIRQVLYRVHEMEEGNHSSEFYSDMFARAMKVYIDALGSKLGTDSSAWKVLKNSHELFGESGQRLDQPWNNPIELRQKNPDFFNCGQNIEEYIVTAVELHGIEELREVRRALEEQRESAATIEIYEELTKYLEALRMPIHRIASRDCIPKGDLHGFAEHWRKVIDHQKSLGGVMDLTYLMDVLCGWNVFSRCNQKQQAEEAMAYLEESFDAIQGRLEIEMILDLAPSNIALVE